MLLEIGGDTQLYANSLLRIYKIALIFVWHLQWIWVIDTQDFVDERRSFLYGMCWLFTDIDDPAKGFEGQSVSNPNDEYPFYEPEDGKNVPLLTQSVLATDHFSHIAVPEQSHPLSNSRSIVPFPLATIPADKHIALAPQPYDEGHLSVDGGRMFGAMVSEDHCKPECCVKLMESQTAASQEHSSMSSLDGDQGYLHNNPPPQRILQTDPPLGEPLNSQRESAFGPSSASSIQQLGRSVGMSQRPFMGWNNTSPVWPIATGKYMLDSNTFGPSLHSTPASHPVNADLNGWHTNPTSSDALFEGAYTMATNASRVSNTRKPGMELLPEPTNTADHLLAETGFLSEELLAFEDVDMISAQHSTQVIPHSLTSSKVAKPKTPIRQSAMQVKYRITGSMDQVPWFTCQPSGLCWLNLHRWQIVYLSKPVQGNTKEHFLFLVRSSESKKLKLWLSLGETASAAWSSRYLVQS